MSASAAGKTKKRAGEAPGAAPMADPLAAVEIPGLGKVGDVAATWKPIEWTRRWDRNPRINANAVDGVAESIKRYGFGAPLVCRGDGTLIAGDTRIQAAHRLKLDAVPVRVMDHLTTKQARALAALDNKLAERATWDEPLLEALLAEQDAAFAELFDGAEAEADQEKDTDRVREINVSELRDTFFLTVRGPIPKQPEAIRLLQAALESLGDDVEVSVGMVRSGGLE